MHVFLAAVVSLTRNPLLMKENPRTHSPTEYLLEMLPAGDALCLLVTWA